METLFPFCEDKDWRSWSQAMKEELGGITRRLEKLRECLAKLEPLQERSREDFDQQPYFKDIVERNLALVSHFECGKIHDVFCLFNKIRVL